jgi:histidinol-phosphate aminotransferase
LDANENSLGSPLIKWYNRYPDPMQWKIKEKLSVIKQVPTDQIFLGNGSDEPIDLLFRCFCEPGVDEVIVFPPTYGMYEVSANINNIHLSKVPLTKEFQLDLEALESAIKPNTKIIWICSPNNPTGNSIDRQDIEMVLNNFDGLVVVDEAYINFSRQKSLVSDLADYPNLVVLQTLSKAWGLAGLRVGMAFASAEIIGYLNKVKPPYNISEPVQELALKALDEIGQVNDMIIQLVASRKEMERDLVEAKTVVKVFPSDANFLLVEFTDARRMYDYLVEKGIVVRDRSNVLLCDNCLRITVGTHTENLKLMEAINSFQ